MRVTAADRHRLGDDADALVARVSGRDYMRMRDGRCVALEKRAGRFACGVYGRRPAACRALERGTPACQAEMGEKMARALRVLRG